MVRSLKVLTLNVNGLSSDLKRYRLSSFTKQQNIDILFLQETHKAKRDKKPLLKDPRWKVIVEARSNSKARGVAILVHRKYDIKLKEVIPNGEGRYLLVKCLFEGKVITLANIYAPNKGQKRFLIKKNSSSRDSAG
ncbi:hypothetical protein JRQ81_016452 [Phrynocephalus forsythii]|uniref:exodeoxyribonuclease III n=1 Tax=Phrynocephalus forsythii TaxID=171643 RepID=A0A9Q1B0X3_9SAUR|nr:hypothetical protein JRQ81_016452 [Phrynocephalus forsythii]